MTDFFGGYDPDIEPQGLRNLRVIGPYWSAWLASTHGGRPRQSSVRSIGAAGDKPDLIEASVYGIRNNPNSAILPERSSLFVDGLARDWLEHDYKSGGSLWQLFNGSDGELPRGIVGTVIGPWRDNTSGIQGLPVLHLTLGHIPLRVPALTLKRLRGLLGGSAAGDQPGGGLVYLTPDGVAFFASVRLPGLSSAVIQLWLVLTHGPDGPVLVPWDAAPKDIWTAGDRIAAQDAFAAALSPLVQTGQDSALLFDMRPRRPLVLTDYYWPLSTKGKGAKALVAPAEGKMPEIRTRGEALSLRLSERDVNGTKPPKSNLLLLPGKVTLRQAAPVGGAPRVELLASDGAQSAGGRLSYSYAPDKESLSLSGLRLQVPLRDTARTLFGADPETTSSHRRLFVPLGEGWIDCGFPTPEVDDLADEAGKDLELTPRARSVGAMGIGNRDGDGGRFEYNWNVTIEGSGRFALSCIFAPGADRPEACQISLEMDAPVVSSSGLLRGVAHENDPARLLPDHAERALTSRALEARDATLLSELERRALRHHHMTFSDVSLTMEVGPTGVALTNATYAVTAATRKRNEAGDAFEDIHLGTTVLWRRHATLPSIQNQSLTQAGSAQRDPCGTRELAPFSVPAGWGLSGTPTGLMQVSASRLKSALDAPVAAGAELTWNEQLGMALTTLPSVTLMPEPVTAGRSARREADAWVVVTDGWASGIGAAARLRYDVALRDGKRAGTEVPQPERADEKAKDAPPARTALKAPEIAFDTSPSEDSIARAVAVWSKAFRADVLSAVAMRDMLAKVKGGPMRLTNLGRGSFSVADDVSVAFSFAPADDTLGSYRMSGLTETPLDIRGLPWSRLSALAGGGACSDVEGLSFDRDTLKVTGGAAVLSRSKEAAALEDQLGMTLHDAQFLKDFTLRRLEGPEGTVDLLSCRRPLAIGKLKVWFSDLALDATGRWQWPTAGAFFPNAQHPELNALLSHRRWVGPVDKDDCIEVFGVRFRPARLRKATVVASDGTVELEISGQIVMNAVATKDRNVPRDVGEARLILSRDAQGKDIVKLTAGCLAIPLRDPDGTVQPVGRVVLKEVAFTDSGVTVKVARLDLPLLGRTWQIDLDVTSEGRGMLTLTKTGITRGSDIEGGAFRVTETKVAVGGDLNGVTDATAECMFSVGIEAPLQVSGLTYNLTLPDPLGITVEAALHAPGFQDDDTLAATFEITSAGAALVWDNTDLQRSFLPGIDISGSRGWAVAAFDAPGVAPTGPFAALEDWRLDLRHAGEGTIEARYAAAKTAGDGPWHITADLSVANEIRFPLPQKEAEHIGPRSRDAPAMRLATYPAAAFNTPLRHRARIELSSHTVSEADRKKLASAEGTASLAFSTKVEHRLEHDGNTTSWLQYQQVRIWSMTALKAKLQGGGKNWTGWKHNTRSGLFSTFHAKDFIAALPTGAGVLALEFGTAPCLETADGAFVLAALPAFGLIGGTLGAQVDRLLNRAGGGETVINFPQLEAELVAPGPGTQLRRRRAADLAGRAVSEPDGAFIPGNLNVPLMADWRTRAETGGSDYLPVGAGLLALLEAGTGARPALSLLPHDTKKHPLLEITALEPFFAALTEARVESFAEARIEGVRAAPAAAPSIVAVSGATGLLTAPRAYVAASEDNADHRVYLLAQCDRTASLGVLTAPDVAHRIARNTDVPGAVAPVTLWPVDTGTAFARDTQFAAVDVAAAAEHQPYSDVLQAGPVYQSATPEVVATVEPQARLDPAARATRRALTASLAATGHSFDGTKGRVWLSEASRPLLRPATVAGPKNPASIAFDPGSAEALPLAYDPGGGPLPEKAGAPGKSYLPAGVTVSRLSQTAGVVHADQLRAVVATNAGLVACSSTSALFQRAPRPGQLGRNARLRPSQFEIGHAILSPQPVTTLYGSSVPQTEPGSRAPDARSARRVVLTIPEDGLLDPGWTGEIALSLTLLPGSDRLDVLEASVAWVILQGKPYTLELAENLGALLRFRPKKPDDLKASLARLTGVETAQFVMVTTVKREGMDPFKRRISLDLWARGDGGEPLADRPGYFLFEDPGLDDLTRGASHMTARSMVATIGGTELMWSFRVASESDEITPQQTFTLILGAINPATGLVGTGKKIPPVSRFRLVRLRPSDNPDEPPEERKIWPKEDEDIGAGWSKIFDPTLDFEGDNEIAAGDTLLAEWDIDGSALRLFIRVVNRPRPSNNPATYAILDAALREGGRPVACSSPIYDESGDPSDRELIDPFRLLNGVANFRNRFRRRIFIAPGQGMSRFAIQKIDGAGSSWLPPLIATDWLTLEA